MKPFFVSVECAFVAHQLGKCVCKGGRFFSIFPSFNNLTLFVVLKGRALSIGG